MSANVMTPDAGAARAKVLGAHPEAFYDPGVGCIKSKLGYPCEILSSLMKSEPQAWLEAHQEILEREVSEIAVRMRVLEASLAFEHTSSTVKEYCSLLDVPYAPRHWFDTATCSVDLIREALEYLEWRGFLLRDPANPNHVAIKDELDVDGPDGKEPRV